MNQEDINEIISKSTPEWRCRQTRGDCDYLELQSKYHELLYAVEQKIPGETRHQTALRYIKEREHRCQNPACSVSNEYLTIV